MKSNKDKKKVSEDDVLIGDNSYRTRIYLDETIEQNLYSIYIDGEIGPPEHYREELQVIRTASENDTIMIHLCTVGGYEDTAFLFMEAIRSSSATVIANIGPECASGGAMIALACNAWNLNRFSSMMMHNVSYGIGCQKEREVQDYANYMKKRNDRIALITCDGFLTKEEFKDFVNGRDLWFDVDELHVRFQHLAEYRRSQQEAGNSKDKEQFEEIEFIAEDPLTWGEGSVVQFSKAVSPFKKGDKALIVGYVESKIYDELIELISEDEQKAILLFPDQFHALKYIEV